MAEVERDDKFYMTLVVIQVEDCLFRLPRQILETQSIVFRNMFSLPHEGAEGSSDDNPIHLDGIMKKEFKCFLEALYMGGFWKAGKSSSNFDTWFPVVKLSHMWEFDTIHDNAIQKMPYDQIGKSTAAKVDLAVRYGIRPWLLPALNELAQRKEPLGNDDLDVLGPELALKVAAIRESIALSHVHSSCKLVSGSRDASSIDFTPVIKHIFRISDDGEDQV